MKSGRIVVSMLVACFTVGMTAGAAFAADTGPKCVRIQGAKVIFGLVDKRIRAFSREHPDFCAVVSGAKTEEALQRLCDGSADMAVTGRKLTESEKAAYCRNRGRIEQVLLGAAAPALVVQSRNPVDSLTLEQVRKIFTGEYSNWSDVGGPNRPIRVLAASPKKDLAGRMFRLLVLRGEPYSPKAAIVSGSYRLLDMCARSKGYAVTVAPYAFYAKSKSKDKVKLLAIRSNEAAAAVKPSPATLMDGTYFLRKPFYLCWNTNSGRSEALAQFADFNRKILAAGAGHHDKELSKLRKNSSVR